MTIKSHFSNNFSSNVEQSLFDDLIRESIQIYGIDMVYVPRIIGNEDVVFGEDKLSSFENTYTIEMYVKTNEGFQGEQDFLSKFGLELRDEIVFTVNRNRFETVVTERLRPTPGDLIYFPLTEAFYEIKFSEDEEVFYQTGTLHTYELTCELWESGGEEFNTGNTVFDDYENTLNYNQKLFMTSNTGDYIIGETVYQGANLEVASVTAEVINWTVANTTLEVLNVTSTFTGDTNIIGANSGVSYIYEPIIDVETDELEMDNLYSDSLTFETNGDSFIDQTEGSPFTDKEF